MSEKEIVNLDIISDDFLIDQFQRRLDTTHFIRPNSKTLITELNKTNLNIQSDKIKIIWRKLVEDAIIFLKSEDEREKYHDAITLGTDKLINYLDEFQNFELILYGAIPNYRDHIIHVFRTYLLGDYLINNSFTYVNIKIGINSSLSISENEKEAIWCITCLCHDLGYPLEGINKINEKARNIIKQYGSVSIKELEYNYFSQFEKICDFAIDFISSNLQEKEKDKYVVHKQPKYYQKFMSALGDLNHGVLSSIILMKDLVFFKESDYTFDENKLLNTEDARQFLIRNEILRSIASHSSNDIYHLTIPNFSFLLCAFDEMQEWGRPRLVDITKRGETLTELKIKEFGSKHLDYKITFRFKDGYTPEANERLNARAEAKSYFIAKSKKWLNVLRSAVGGDLRVLELNFETEDKSHAASICYSLKHKTPSDIEINPPDLRPLLLE